jgi:hypothetical protein
VNPGDNAARATEVGLVDFQFAFIRSNFLRIQWPGAGAEAGTDRFVLKTEKPVRGGVCVAIRSSTKHRKRERIGPRKSSHEANTDYSLPLPEITAVNSLLSRPEPICIF